MSFIQFFLPISFISIEKITGYKYFSVKVLIQDHHYPSSHPNVEFIWCINVTLFLNHCIEKALKYYGLKMFANVCVCQINAWFHCLKMQESGYRVRDIYVCYC